MANDEPIKAVEIQETEYGEKVVLDSPFDAKDFIKVLPFRAASEEIEEHGSVAEKAISRGMDADNVAIDAANEFDFSDDFSAHASWDPTALGYDDGAWIIDVDGFDEAREFFEFCGFDVSVGAGVDL